MVWVLAKLTGQDGFRGMAHWAKLRTKELSELFHLKREHMRHYSTWSRVLGYGVEQSRVEQIVGQFFAQAIRASRSPRGSIHLAIDGKTRRRNHSIGRNGRRAFVGHAPEMLAVLNTIVPGFFARQGETSARSCQARFCLSSR